MTDKLLPCPFCGGKADIDRCGNRWQAWCRHCATIQMGEFYDTEADAIAAWNRRAQPENEPLTCKNCIQFMEWENPTEYDGDCRIRVFYSVMREYQCVKKTDFCSFGERKPERSNLDA